MHPLREAVHVKGSPEFTRAELVGILSFRLRLMSVGEAKESIQNWIESGLLIEDESGMLRVVQDALEGEEGKEDVFEEMLNYVASSLGWEREEVLEAAEELAVRYGNISRKLALYLLGVEKGLDMERFREKLDV
ncbi:MAG: DUF2240 family protein [Thermococci archaeon]|nr:DUF2240 family protein [Thermococci archaeon]